MTETQTDSVYRLGFQAVNRDFCQTARYIYNRRIIEKFSLVARDLFLKGCELLRRTNSLWDRSSKLRPNRQSSFFRNETVWFK